ncbi:hypothetical protein KC19_6G184600 [Ceratodon purpureus]|uniref:Lariat debranching enzyme C-terminal domain-containing protein n=1 Tax=Ceratodon purpureus TaxID=3225 RepID=A0A8T0HIR3_CERPU|nr:hypothetical protein KC19_6G184600 [Ceratodon purpureus]
MVLISHSFVSNLRSQIAVEGCAHGDLDNIYATLQHLEHTENVKIDLLICCGDFQALRNEEDFESLSCPAKFRSMGSFWKYYSGVERAPYPTLFVGGNHEASNYLWELYYGGFVAPNIYFLGFAGVVKFGGVRIGGLSGIFKQGDYRKGHFERVPYNDSDIRSVYHVREYDVKKLLQLEGAIDVFVSHDWPEGVTQYGDVQQLLRHKRHFEQEIEENRLGSNAGKELLHKLKPDYWFAAHLHTKFAAVVPHPNSNKATRFLALDKCLPHRRFLQMVDIPAAAGPLEFTHDEEWLAITRAYHPYFPLTRQPMQLRNPLNLAAQRQWVQKRLGERGSAISMQFTMTAPPYQANQPRGRAGQLPGHVRNPQTEAFLEFLDLPYLLDHASESVPGQARVALPGPVETDPNEIPLEDDDAGPVEADPNEIPLEDDDAEVPENGALDTDDIDELESRSRCSVVDPDEIELCEDED